MLYAFSSAGNLGFHNPIVLVSLAISLVIIGAFIRRQIRISNPLLNIIVFKNKVFCLTTISSMIVMLSMVGPKIINSIICSKCLRVVGVIVRTGDYARSNYQWCDVYLYREIL